jgi:tetratricopeptide (TPR) repeat protein
MIKISRVISTIIYIVIGIVVGSSFTYLMCGKIIEGRAMVLGNEASELKKSKSYQEAIIKYSQAIVLDPKNQLNHLGLAETFENVGEMDLALKEYNIVLKSYREKNYQNLAKNLEKRIASFSKNGTKQNE